VTQETYEKERRRFERLSVSVPMFIRGSDADKDKEFLHFVTAVNISAGGMLVASRSYLPPGCDVTIEFPEVPLLPEAVAQQLRRKLQARVVRGATDKTFLLGLEFAEPLSRNGTVGGKSNIQVEG
jgi:c-di-GMP-binding flagellar brake protein YcgR